jgi:type VI secretion system secreted protein Hcp
MKFRSLSAFCLLVLLVPIQAATDYFLVIEGIEGESTDARYPKAIEVESFSMGVHQTLGTTAGGGTTTGKATFSDLAVTKNLDKSSPILYLNCAQGKHIPKATLYVRKAGEKPLEYYVVTMSDVIITSVQTSGGRGSTPTESLSLNFSKIEYSYKAQNPDGSLGLPVTSGWDLKANVRL